MVRLNFVRFRTLPSCKKRIRSILRKEPERRHGAHLPPHPPSRHSPPTPLYQVAQNSLKFRRSVRPYSRHNAEIIWRGKRVQGAEWERIGVRGRNRGAAARSSSFTPSSSFSSLDRILRNGSEPPSVGRLLRGRTKNCSSMYNELRYVWTRISGYHGALISDIIRERCDATHQSVAKHGVSYVWLTYIYMIGLVPRFLIF